MPKPGYGKPVPGDRRTSTSHVCRCDRGGGTAAAVLPPEALVVRSRWLENERLGAGKRGLWCHSDGFIL